MAPSKRTPHTFVKRDSASGRILETVKKDIHESVDLYFRPVKVLAGEFTKVVKQSGQATRAHKRG